MEIDELEWAISEEGVKAIKLYGIAKLNDPQEKAVKNGLFGENNLVVSAKTASGKTLIAEMAALNTILVKKRKVVYLAPLRSISHEKFIEFRRKYKVIFKIAISVGDYDNSDEDLANYDLIITTPEKFDSIMRHMPSWLKDVKLVIVDEIHTIGDIERGGTLEAIISVLKAKGVRIIGLSATISNAEEIAEWLNAKLVESSYRPIPCKNFVFWPFHIMDENSKCFKIDAGNVVDLINHYVKKGKQVLCFVNSRRNTQRLCENLFFRIEKDAYENEEALEKIAKKVLDVSENPTEQCKALAKFLNKGIAFHHAGLLHEQRRIIEEFFKSGLIKVIVATPTLAAGVNLPASIVIVAELHRYVKGYGMRRISVMECRQMLGRSGRPGYDSEGIGIICCKSEKESNEILKKYVKGETEPVFSALAYEPVLRTQLLGMIASGIIKTENDARNFIRNTFYRVHYGDEKEIMEKIKNVLSELEVMEMIKVRDNKDLENENTLFVRGDVFGYDKVFEITKIGLRTAQLYIDPYTSHFFVNWMRKTIMPDLKACLGCIANAKEFRVYPPIKKSELDFFIFPEIGVLDPKIGKAIAILESWINEVGEDEIMDKYGVPPGDLRIMIENAVWLCYSAKELADCLKRNDLKDIFSELEIRIKHGVKKDIIDLVTIKGVGRKRARELFNNGIQTREDVKRNKDKLISLFGKKLGTKIWKNAYS